MNSGNSGVGDKDNADFFGKSRRPYQLPDLHHCRFRESAEPHQIDRLFALPIE
jgi:hypothetical protein